jgi:hypothetical protein
VHGLDDVAADRELAQRLFEVGFERPTGRSHLLGKTEPLQLGGPADHQSPQLRVFTQSAGPEIDDAGSRIGVVAEGAVEVGPTLSLHLPFQGRTDLPLAAGAEL